MSTTEWSPELHAAPTAKAFGGGGGGARGHFRKAGLLDLPFIFHQIVAGSVNGAFSERFLSGGGTLHLFKLLLWNLLPFRTHRLYEFHVFQNRLDEVGFAGIHTSFSEGETIIAFFCVAPEHQGKGNGRQMMERLIEHLPADAGLVVYATKYAVEMQRLLARAGFRRAGGLQNGKTKRYVLGEAERAKRAR